VLITVLTFGWSFKSGFDVLIMVLTFGWSFKSGFDVLIMVLTFGLIALLEPSLASSQQ
jgi:hypothetical protein